MIDWQRDVKRSINICATLRVPLQPLCQVFDDDAAEQERIAGFGLFALCAPRFTVECVFILLLSKSEITRARERERDTEKTKTSKQSNDYAASWCTNTAVTFPMMRSIH